ncbi:hypothetical protein KC349_g8146 [Hortaea werneckii]|nr:hypothetical protein KC349_g8146 [Hortaea werneckii]
MTSAICRRGSSILAAIFIISILLYLHQSALPSSGPNRTLATSSTQSQAGNATLGFGTILVLTTDMTSWRIQGLQKAAEAVGITLTIPQLALPDEDLVHAAPTDTDDPDSVLDSYRAALSHVALLEHFLDTGLETALIFEDDVDFGLSIKDQMTALSETLWSTAGSTAADHPEDPFNQASWDILWLGHCGLELVANTHIIHYNDPNALGWDRLTGCLNDWYTQQRNSGVSQTVLQGVAPIGSYAYGVTRERAASLVEENTNRTGRAFDFTLHRDCKGLHQRCTAPVPELFHHHKVIGEKSIGVEGEVVPQDLAWYQNQHMWTFNIEWSARCNAAGTGEKVSGRRRCMPGLYDWPF